MAELDTIPVFNPLKEAIVVRFNGEPYPIDAQTTKYYPSFLAFHIAKVISDKILEPELLKIKKDAKPGNPFNPKNAQLVIYDNPRRRIALHKILGSKQLVEECIAAFPFKGFIGEMAEYDEFVESLSTNKPAEKKLETPA